MPPNKEQKERLREWLELADDLSDAGGDAVDGPNDVGVVKPGGVAQVRGGRNVGNAYERGHAACHLHVSLETRRANPHAQDFCIQYERLTDRYVPVLDPLSPKVPEHVREDLNGEDPRQNRIQQPVFVVVGQLPEPEKGMRDRRAVPSVARLVPLDDCPMARKDIPQSLFLSSLKPPRFSAGKRGFLDGERNASGVPGLASASLKEGQLPDEVIQCPPEIMERVAKDKAEPGQQVFWGQLCNPKNVVSAFRLELYAQSNVVFFDPDGGVNLALKDVAVLFGPPEFVPATTEVGLVGHG
jgi:hypothetical protein